MEKKRHIFVAGGAGYIGSACTEYLLDRGYEVTVFDSLVTGHRKAVDKRAVFIQGDLADRELLLDLFRKNSYDAVMHFAAFSLVGESMKDPGKYFRNNVANAQNLADAAVDFRKDRKKGKYNPYLAMGDAEDWPRWEDYLVLAMGRCTEYYERLPLVQDKKLLDNILYSGIWVEYRRRQGRKNIAREDSND